MSKLSPVAVLTMMLFLTVTVFAQGRGHGPKPKPSPTVTPTPSPTPIATPTPTPVPSPTPMPTLSPTPSPSPSQFRVDEFGQVTATNYNTWSSFGSYRIGGQTVLRWDSTFSNFTLGKLATNLSFPGQQNFMGGNIVQMPSGCCNTTWGWDSARPTSGNGNTAIGHDAGLGLNTGSYNVFIGMQAGPPDQTGSVQVNSSIGIGVGAQATGDNQALIGGEIGFVRDVYFGSGVSSVSPAAVTVQSSGGRGENNRGAALTIAAGRSTGSAVPPSIFFATSAPTVSGTASQQLVKHWEIDAQGTLKAVGGEVVQAAVQLKPASVKPACSLNTRLLTWPTAGPDGVGDFVEICLKSASGIYQWRVWMFPQ